MKPFRLLCLAALLAIVGFAPAPLPRKGRAVKRDDLAVLQGVWKMTYQDAGGTPTDHNFEVVVKGDRWDFVQPGRRGGGGGYYLTLDQTVSPRALEWAFDQNRTSGWVGSFRIQGKTLTVVYTSGTLKKDLGKRPTDF